MTIRSEDELNTTTMKHVAENLESSVSLGRFAGSRAYAQEAMNANAPDPGSAVNDESGQPSGNILTAIWLLWFQRRLLIVSALIGFCAVAALSFLIRNKYESTVRLVPAGGNSNPAMMLAGMAGNAIPALGMETGDLFGLKSSGALFVAILNSRTEQDRLIDRFDLRKVYHVSKYEQVRNILEAQTIITEDRKSGVITLTVTDTDPKRAAALAQAYVEELDRLSAELNSSAAHRERVFIEERLKIAQDELDAAEEDLSDFSSRNSTIDLKEQGRAMVEAAARVQGELIAARSELKGLEQSYTPSSVRVQTAKARTMELERQLAQLGGGSDSKKGANNGEVGYPNIRELPILGKSYTKLYRREKIAEAVYESLTKQYEISKIEEAKETPTIRVLDSPNVPELKSAPHRLHLSVVGMFSFLLLAAAWVLGKAKWANVADNDPKRVLVRQIACDIRRFLS